MATSMEVIEHTDNQIQFFEDSLSRVKPNGLFFLSTLETGPVSYLFNILIAEKVLGVVEEGMHHHEKFVSLEGLKTIAQISGARLIDYQYYLYDPIHKVFKKDFLFKTNYLVCFQKL